MEELKQEKIFMLWESLDEKFNLRQWRKIKQLPSYVFLKIQEGIVEQLMHNQKLYAKYFIVENFSSEWS